ncbi:MAG: hypothetical protein GY913_07060 [Proteobacteria bacterium]|nr:hypothetical protein [Pseudomonadota bacterium]MCP4916667.1 hypothetical protein [Pseudomonadota bacterium]
MTLVLIGPHGVGKSSLGRALADELGWTFHGELGEELARSIRTDGDASSPQPEFDRQLFELEHARDRSWCGAPRIVETWHPGNLAYAERRSPSLVEGFQLSPRGRVLVLPLQAPVHVLAARKHEPGPLEFFMHVGLRARVWASRLGLELLPDLSTHLGHPDALAQRLAPTLLSRSS